MRKIDRGILYWNTVRNLKPVQIKHQIINRVKESQKPQKYGMAGKPDKIRIVIPELDEDRGYLERFDVAALLYGRVTLLHETHELNGFWAESSASHLWNYNLHYLEFLIPLAAEYHATGDERYRKKYVEILESWMEAASDSKDAYAPYTISMRIPNILIGMELQGGFEESLEQKIYVSLYDQYRYLLQHTELALLANHYFENIKTIVIASVLFREPDVYRRYFDLLLKQIDEQILPDGVHYERSLMYHKIILEDILRVYTVMQSAGRRMDAEKLLPAIKSMAEAVGSIERGFGRTPLFNDAGDNISKTTYALLKACGTLCADLDTEKNVFPDAGYYRLDHGNAAVLFDSGEIGPKYMAGHAHNDCLSFELYFHGDCILSNSGTGQYQGDKRQFFRSTKAHNTVMIDDREQSELWGEHRAARRISHVKAMAEEESITGQFQSYRGDRFRRKILWQKDGLVITDDVKCRDSDRHIARQFFHLAPGYKLKRDGKKINVVSGDKSIAVIVLPEKADFLIHKEGQITEYAGDFGAYERKQVLEVRTPFVNIVKINILIRTDG